MPLYAIFLIWPREPPYVQIFLNFPILLKLIWFVLSSQDIPKSFQKCHIYFNLFWWPRGFCHPLRPLCSVVSDTKPETVPWHIISSVEGTCDWGMYSLYIFNSEQCSKVLIDELLLQLFLLAWGKHEQKMLLIEPNFSKGNKTCPYKVLDEYEFHKATYGQIVIFLALRHFSCVPC